MGYSGLSRILALWFRSVIGLVVAAEATAVVQDELAGVVRAVVVLVEAVVVVMVVEIVEMMLRLLLVCL